MLNSAELTIVVFKAIIALVSFVGNSFVCFVVIRNRDMRTAFNFMIVNLALGDIFYTTFLLAHFSLSLYLSNPYDITGNSICIVLRKLTWLGSYSAVCTMIVIARERYYTVVHPHESKGKLTMQKLKVVIPITWLLSLLINMRGFVMQSFSGDIPLKSCDHNWTDKKMHKIHLGIWGFFVTVSSVTMITFYSIVVYTLWFKRSNNNESAYQQQGVMRMRKRVTLMVLVVSAMFEVCWITDTIIHLLQSASSYAIPIAHTVIMFSSAVNPFVYSLISQRFRAKMKDMLLCVTRLCPERKIHASEAPYIIQVSLNTLNDQVHTKETSDETTSGTL